MFSDLIVTAKIGILELVQDQATTTVTSLTGAGAVKAFYALSVAGVSYLFGIGNLPFIGALGVLMAIDCITGVVGARAQNEPITPKGFFRSATKLLVYSGFLIAGHMATIIVPAGSFIDTAMYSFLSLTELVSVLENIGRMGYSMPQRLLNQLISLRGKQKAQGPATTSVSTVTTTASTVSVTPGQTTKPAKVKTKVKKTSKRASTG